MKFKFLVVLLLAGIINFSGVMASQEGQDIQPGEAPSSEDVVAMCEDQFNSENHPDENERNDLVDQCINDVTDQMAPPVEQG